jgi:hypothetical protein
MIGLAHEEPFHFGHGKVLMKHLLSPLTALMLAVTGYSLHAAGWLPSSIAESRQAEARQESDPFASEAAFRHRTAQPTHWRALLMRH